MTKDLAKALGEFLEQRGVKHQVEGRLYDIGVALDDIPPVRILIRIDDDNETGKFFISGFIKVPVEKAERIEHVLNMCNSQYRWARFSLLDTDIVVDGDVILVDERSVEALFHHAMLAAQVIEDAYPTIMAAMYGA